MDRRQFISSSLGITAAAVLPWPVLSAEKTISYLKLSSNENPLGMSPNAIKAAREALLIGHRYGDGLAEKLKHEIALVETLPKDAVTLGNGSTGILEAVFRLQLVKGATLIQPGITYGAAKELADSGGMKKILVPMGKTFSIDMEAMEAASLSIKDPVVVYLVTPNNPTGLLAPYKDLAAWIRRAPANVFFVIDEAYHELVNDPEYQSCTQLISEGYENLIVARTFSKVYAMAGMRIGYGLAVPKLIKELQEHYSSWSINTASIQAARASLKDHDFIAASIKNIKQSKAVTEKGLQQLGLDYIPSQGNFLIHQIKMNLKAYQDRMRHEGIRVGRDMNLGYGWNRLSLGTPSEMQKFLATLGKIQQGGWV